MLTQKLVREGSEQPYSQKPESGNNPDVRQLMQGRQNVASVASPHNRMLFNRQRERGPVAGCTTVPADMVRVREARREKPHVAWFRL